LVIVGIAIFVVAMSGFEYKIAGWFCVVGIIGVLLIIFPNIFLKTGNIYNEYSLTENNKTYYILKRECKEIKYSFDYCTDVESTSVTIAELNDIYDNIIKKTGDK
jgi:cell division protein FtsW (lipid II flippase)